MKKHLFLLSLVLLACSPEQRVEESLVYLVRKDANFDLYQSDLLGKWQRKITDNPGWDWQPRWNEGRQQLVYYSNDTAGHFSVIARDFPSGKMDTLPNSDLLNFQLSPSGKEVYYVEKEGDNSHIKRCPINDPSASENLTNSDSYNGRFTISNDETKMAFISDRDGLNQLYLMDLVNKEVKQLTSGQMIAKYSSFAPDGMRIAVTLAEPSEDPVWDIYIVDLETLEISQLTNNPYSETEIAWSLSGEKIALHGITKNDGDQIYTVDLADGKFTKITSGKMYYGEPTWVPYAY